MIKSHLLLPLSVLAVSALATEHQFSVDPVRLARINSDYLGLKMDYQWGYDTDRFVRFGFLALQDESCVSLGVSNSDCSMRDMHVELAWKPLWYGLFAEPSLELGYLSKYSKTPTRVDDLYRDWVYGARFSLGYQYAYKSIFAFGALGVGNLILPRTKTMNMLFVADFGLGWSFGFNRQTSAR